MDAGEVKGKKRIYLQVNSQASNLALGDIDINEPEEKFSGAFDQFWQGIEKQAKDNLG